MHEKNLDFVLLFDFYSPVLTEKQREIFDMYYNNDYSLSEIADSFSISRQGVHDIIKRTEGTLVNYENKLKMADRFSKQQQKLKELVELTGMLKNDKSDKTEVISKVIQLANELIMT